MDLVTVIVPVYNVKNYLRKCLESIVKQTYRNLEIILVDDGSNDGSFSICRNFLKIDSRIKMYHTKNMGLSHARNVGLNYANGDYIIFVDSDDYIHENMINIMMHEIGNADLAICNYKKVMVNSNIKLLQDQGITKDGSWNFEQFWQHYYDDNLRAFCCVAWNKLYKRELFNNVRYPLNKIHEDEYIINEIVNQCKKIKVINDSLYYYVQRPNSIMHSSYQGKFDLAEALLGRCDSFCKYGLNDILYKNLNEIPTLIITGIDEIKDSKEAKKRYCLLRKRYNFYLKRYLKDNFSIKLYLKQVLLMMPKVYRLSIELKSKE